MRGRHQAPTGWCRRTPRFCESLKYGWGMGAFLGFSKGISQCREETQSHLSQGGFGNTAGNSWRRDCQGGAEGLGSARMLWEEGRTECPGRDGAGES